MFKKKNVDFCTRYFQRLLQNLFNYFKCILNAQISKHLVISQSQKNKSI